MQPDDARLRRWLVFHLVSLFWAVSITVFAFTSRLTLLGVIFAVSIVATLGNILVILVQMRQRRNTTR